MEKGYHILVNRKHSWFKWRLQLRLQNGSPHEGSIGWYIIFTTIAFPIDPITARILIGETVDANDELPEGNKDDHGV